MLIAWKRSPMLRILLPFLTGILCGLHTYIGYAFVLCLCCPCILVLIYLLRRKSSLSYRMRFIPVALLIPVTFLLGWCSVSISLNSKAEDHFTCYPETDWLQCRLLDVVAERENSFKVVVDVVALSYQKNMLSASGKILLYLEKNKLAAKLSVDDLIMVRSEIAEVNPPANPFVFDYKSYLEHHEINHQCYADSLSWKFAGSRTHSFKGWFIAIREKLLQRITEEDIPEPEFDVMAALLLGKTAGLDEEVLTAYSGTGTIHVLAVSGLHVALIYIVLSPVFARILPGNRGRVWRVLIPVTILWIYAGITGFSPSVLRAALMFTCFIVSDNFKKQNNIFNTMSVSAMILFFFNPLMIAETGFQLSYLAVLGIIVLQQPICHLWIPSNRILLWAWKLSAVSLSAQLATLPVTLYYFHQFPNYFLLSNFVVIPISTVVLYTGLSFFVFCWIPYLGALLVHVTELLIRLMNSLMTWMSQWPGSVADHIYISNSEAVVISCLIISLSCWIFFRKTKMAIVSMLCVLTWLGLSCSGRFSDMYRSEICFHQVKGHTCVSQVSADGLTVCCDTLLMSDHKTIHFSLDGYWDYIGGRPSEVKNINDEVNGFFSNGLKSVLIVNTVTIKHVSEMDPDIVFFPANTSGHFLDEEIFESLRGRTVILDHSYSKKKKTFLRSKLNQGTAIFDLSDGAVLLRNDSLAHFSKFY